MSEAKINQLIKKIRLKNVWLEAQRSGRDWVIISRQSGKDLVIFRHDRATKTTFWLEGFLSGLEFNGTLIL